MLFLKLNFTPLQVNGTGLKFSLKKQSQFYLASFRLGTPLSNILIFANIQIFVDIIKFLHTFTPKQITIRIIPL